MKKDSNGFATLSQALDDLKAGKMIIVTDDPNRENEGDLICAAEFATTGNVNFMATYGKGLICMPMSKEIANKLALPQMVSENTDNHCTAFTVSIDHVDTTTGISAVERGITARKIVDENSKPEDFRRPGHMFPLVAKDFGVLERSGHTEATVDLMRLAGLKECGLCCDCLLYTSRYHLFFINSPNKSISILKLLRKHIYFLILLILVFQFSSNTQIYP